ncbi:hypothetical protein [Brevundimonas subvibrioides]|uniref:hypothetical protein n=1 Tax=Brevundimonas subvibrioides TaxID=74313 RepID=UPI0022B56A8C|nr:hypothetical protein [Brevundimonas subvibrioides]
MKRPFAIQLMFGVALIVTGCGAPAEKQAGPQAATDGWVAGPQVDQVSRAAGIIRVSGTAAPFGRVVLTGPDGVAYAAGADETGHFDIRLPAPRTDALLAVEAQVGQIAYPAPGRLLVSADPGGPVALLGIGAPTRRLDGTGALDAVDADGRAGFLSGRATANTDVTIVRNGVSLTAASDPQGRWTLAIGGDVGAPIQIGDRAFVPPAMTEATSGSLVRAGQGWRIGWISPDGARQVTWLPDRSQ